jgi:dipeptidyl aminopeptidase/acylaminoacyl peptidase
MTFNSVYGRILVCAALCGALAVAVVAATPPNVAPSAAPNATALPELDEIVVAAKTVIRLDDFVELPKYDSVSLSPSGTRLAMGWIDVNNYSRAISIYEFPSMKPVITHGIGAEFSASDVRWAGENRLLLQANWPLRGLLRIWEPLGMIRLIDPDGGKPHNINGEAMSSRDPLPLLRREEEAVAIAARTLQPSTGKLASRNSMGPVRLVSMLSGQPDQILFQTTRANDRGGNTDSSGAFLLNLKDNKQTRVATLPLPGGQFVTGPDHRVALATGVNARNETVVYYLPEKDRAQGTDWQLVTSSKTGERGLRPVAWSGNGEEYFALDGRGGPTQAVVMWNATTNATRLLHRNANVDLDKVSLDPSDRPWMFTGVDHFPVYWYPDPEHPLARLHRAVVQKARDELVEITSASDDMTSAVVRVTSPRRPPIYMPVNTKNVTTMAPSSFSYPTLRGTRLAQVDPIEFRARDGLVIRGYLTTPEDGNGKPRTGLPLLVIAHDGPLAEPAGPGYEFERQLFASRGYAVLQVNHRGTRGRGAAFEKAGNGKWGREVQSDFADGVLWAIKDGVADGKRVCFYGIGYGAYSAMVTAAREPDLFKCVIGVGGIYDLPRFLGAGKKELPVALQQVLGTDMTELDTRSPVNMAASIKAKVFLMPQNEDEYIPEEQSLRMRTALKDAGNIAKWEPIGTQYDGQQVTATRAATYDKMLRFLEESLGK